MNFEQGADPKTTEKAHISWQIARAWPAREMRPRTEATFDSFCGEFPLIRKDLFAQSS